MLHKKMESELLGLLALVFKDSSQLTDEEISQLLEVAPEMATELFLASQTFADNLRREQQYRLKKVELSKLSAEDLKAKYRAEDKVFKIYTEPRRCVHLIADVPKDSEEYIAGEILKERGELK